MDQVQETPVEETEEVEGVTTENTEAVEETEVAEEAPKTDYAADFEAKNKQLFERAKKAEQEAKAAKARIEALEKANTKSLDVEDYLDINKAFAGLSDPEQAKLAEWHKQTARPLAELRESDDFKLWQIGHSQMVEKEKALKPSSTQPDQSAPRKLSEVLTDPKVPQAEKERLMKEHGLYKDPFEGTQTKVVMR